MLIPFPHYQEYSINSHVYHCCRIESLLSYISRNDIAGLYGTPVFTFIFLRLFL